MSVLGTGFIGRVPFSFRNGSVCNNKRVRCNCTSLVTLSEEEKYYYREIPSFDSAYNSAAPGDYYELLGIDHEAETDEIKTAFRERQRIAHPDIAGESAVDVSVLLNQAYKTLMDSTLRQQYNEELHLFNQSHGVFDGKPVSTWGGSNQEQRAVFVDETSCIGCKNCTMCAPETFVMEEVWGRARVVHQWGDDKELIREAIDMCPVDCIYIVMKKQLALLEFVMKTCEREDAAILARRRSGNMGSAPSKNSPFTRAGKFIDNRRNAKLSSDAVWTHVQTEELAGAIARAWLQLPREIRAKGWPAWTPLENHLLQNEVI
eukprot:g4054.t1